MYNYLNVYASWNVIEAQIIWKCCKYLILRIIMFLTSWYIDLGSCRSPAEELRAEKCLLLSFLFCNLIRQLKKYI